MPLALCVVQSFHRSQVGRLPLRDTRPLSSNVRRRLCFKTTDFVECLCLGGMNSGLSLQGRNVVHLSACSAWEDTADSRNE